MITTVNFYSASIAHLSDEELRVLADEIADTDALEYDWLEETWEHQAAKRYYEIQTVLRARELQRDPAEAIDLFATIIEFQSRLYSSSLLDSLYKS